MGTEHLGGRDDARTLEEKLVRICSIAASDNKDNNSNYILFVPGSKFRETVDVRNDVARITFQ